MSKADDRKLRDAVLEFFKTKHWKDPYAVTLTLKNSRREGEFWIMRKEGDAEQNLRHFLKVLKRLLVRRGFSKDAELQCVPVLEGDDDHRAHFHLLIDRPDCVTNEQFHALIFTHWSKTRWGLPRVDIQSSHDADGWLNYILKLRTKADYAASIDWSNVR